MYDQQVLRRFAETTNPRKNHNNFKVLAHEIPYVMLNVAISPLYMLQTNTSLIHGLTNKHKLLFYGTIPRNAHKNDLHVANKETNNDLHVANKHKFCTQFNKQTQTLLLYGTIPIIHNQIMLHMLVKRTRHRNHTT